MKRILTTLALLLISGIAMAGNVTMTWTPPDVCDDGSALTNCPTSGYEIWMGSSLTGTFVKQAFEPAGTAVSANLTSVSAGQKCFAMKTKSSTLTSVESNRVCVNVPPSGPKAPFINVTIAIPPAAKATTATQPAAVAELEQPVEKSF